ncbi:hypothetical protein NPIL_619681 [Nephila pilipes]|uniref:Uncharacterized protein n=1 Tax=Nephila pilipes TaxID=299642 RepID=A0A8X6MZ13_NEPPI|nr:hypothetical protein NPIL_619681 [Nephila pilipes]
MSGIEIGKNDVRKNLFLNAPLIKKLCKKMNLILRNPDDKPVLNTDHTVDFQKDEPPPYDSLPPSYEESTRNLNQDKNQIS